MMRYWIDIETGAYGVADDIRIVEAEDEHAFSSLLESASESQIAHIGYAFGKPIPESL
jgi:hypothetical protein